VQDGEGKTFETGPIFSIRKKRAQSEGGGQEEATTAGEQERKDDGKLGRERFKKLLTQRKKKYTRKSR